MTTVDQSTHEFPNRAVLLLRGMTRHCPWCGDSKAYFVGWFKREPACRRCHHGFRRGDDAFELGAITANIILTFGTILLAILLMIVFTAPDIPVLWVSVTGAAIGVIGPVLFYPVSFTLWQSIDLFMRRPTDAELAGEGDATL